ncbi:hypothetical protein ACOL3H_06725 [Aliarcobacter butzleri]
MKYKKILLLIAIFSQLNANNYVSNKQYTYNEVTEVLSDKIIETRKEIDGMKLNSIKDHAEMEKKINDLIEKVDALTRVQQIQRNQSSQQIKKESDKTQEKKEIINQFEEIVIDKDLYEKVK